MFLRPIIRTFTFFPDTFFKQKSIQAITNMHSSRRHKSYSNQSQWSYIYQHPPLPHTNIIDDFVSPSEFHFCPLREVDQGEVCLICRDLAAIDSAASSLHVRTLSWVLMKLNQDRSTARQKKQHSLCNSNNPGASKHRCCVHYQRAVTMETHGGGWVFQAFMSELSVHVQVSLSPSVWPIWLSGYVLPVSCNNDCFYLLLMLLCSTCTLLIFLVYLGYFKFPSQRLFHIYPIRISFRNGLFTNESRHFGVLVCLVWGWVFFALEQWCKTLERKS